MISAREYTMRLKTVFTWLAFAAFIAATAALTAQTATPRTAVSSKALLPPERVARIDRALQRYVDENRIAGIVALVLRDGQPVYERAVGWSDKEAGRKMTPDTIFRIASQTKAITSTAILSLVEEGKLTINDPVSRVIPQFAKTTVATGGSVVPAKRPITIRDLLTHTAGISYGTEPVIASQYEAKGLGPGGRLRLVHGRQGRARLFHDGAARHAALRRAAGRAVGVRLQHRHPGLCGRACVGNAARCFHQGADYRTAADDRHAVLPAGGAARPIGRGLRERR